MVGIAVRRKREWMGLIRDIDVYVDDRRVGNLKAGETRLFESPVGAHRLRVQMDWCRSQDVVAEVPPSDGKMLVAGCRFGGWLNMFDLPGILLWPKRFFVVEPVPNGDGDAI